MFEALAVSLGEHKLFKLEDTGRVHPEGVYTAPDFRFVLKDGRQWLIEVKNVYERSPKRQRLQLRKADVEKLTAYADAVGCPLKLAIYWARLRMWTLVDIDELEQSGTKHAITMNRAAILSELSEIGDRLIGAKPPLGIRFLADLSKDHTIAKDGKAHFTIGNVELFCDDKEITDPVEQEIAWIFIQYGDWKDTSRAVVAGDKLEAIEFVFAPRERPNEGQDFEIMGSLSTMFSRYYAVQTIGAEGLVQTEADMLPDWFRPLIDHSHKSDALPLWRFITQPNHAYVRSQ